LFARTIVHKTVNDYVQSAVPVGTDLIATCDFSSVSLFDQSGEKWTTPRIARDGIEFLHTTLEFIEGKAEQSDGWHDFKIDIATGALI
jgi:hypothetical protein